MESLYLKNNIIILLVILFININFANANKVRDEMIRMSQDIRVSELDFKYLSSSKEVLNLKRSNSLKKFKQYSKEISDNFISLYKLHITPTELLLANNYSTKDIAISYTLFNYYNYFLKQNMQNIAQELRNIKDHTNEINKIENEIKAINKDLTNNRAILKKYLKDYNNSAIAKVKNNHQYLIKKHKNTIKLAYKIEQENLSPLEKEQDDLFLKNKGKLIWPNSGFISQKYKKAKPTDLTYNGIIILALANSHIVAPFAGEIIFVGSFYDFNKVIIIKHSPSYYSIISGNFNTYVRETQLVQAYEPIAISSNRLSPLYYELQLDNKSLDPIVWLTSNTTKNK